LLKKCRVDRFGKSRKVESHPVLKKLHGEAQLPLNERWRE
jgi:hypothetical protein